MRAFSIAPAHMGPTDVTYSVHHSSRHVPSADGLDLGVGGRVRARRFLRPITFPAPSVITQPTVSPRGGAAQDAARRVLTACAEAPMLSVILIGISLSMDALHVRYKRYDAPRAGYALARQTFLMPLAGYCVSERGVRPCHGHRPLRELCAARVHRPRSDSFEGVRGGEEGSGGMAALSHKRLLAHSAVRQRASTRSPSA